jgi:tetratricopeptide (TPR) repeat protein/membrane protein implicated in regulation of membrane protease activity
MYQKIVAKFNNLSFIIIAVLCAIIPLIFLPANVGGGGVVKGFILYTGVFLATSIWLIAQFINGSFKVSKSPIFLGLGSWVVLSLISALTSSNISVSLWGRGFVFDSFVTTLVLSLFVFMVATFARDQRKLVKLFLFTFVGSAITVFLQFILYISQNVPFVSKYLGHVANQGTLVGSWVDFAYFVTFVFVLALLMYEVLIPKGFFKILSFITMLVSLLALVFLNFKTAWIVALVSSLVVFVYKSSVERSLSSRIPKLITEEQGEDEVVEKQKFPIMSMVSLLVGLFFLLSNTSIGSSISQSVGISFNDIRPSFTTTTQVMRSSIFHDPLFGAGAGLYSDVWNLHYPTIINSTLFWSSPFESGFNVLESLISTNGLLPVIALIFVLIFSLIHGFKLFNCQFPDRFTRFIAVTSLIMILAFVMLFVFASPGIVLIIFGFTYIGLLFGVSSLVGKTEIVSVDYLKDPRTSFFAILLLVVSSMVGFSAIYFTGNKFASIVIYNKAVAATDVVSAEKYLNKAILLSNNDIYWRAKTSLYVNQFNSLASKENPDNEKLQALFTQAEQSAQVAISLGQTSSTNWLNLSQVYQLIASPSNADAVNNAMKASQEAQTRSPNNPFIRLNNAQIDLINKDNTNALAEIEQALVLKPNYLDAFILRGQIGQSQGNTQAVKNEILKYIAIEPYDEQGQIALGNSYLALKDYQNALNAFSKAHNLNPNNANTYLTYIGTIELTGDKSKAIEELQNFKKQFPNVVGVDDQIKRIQNNQPSTTTVGTEKKINL